jgi:phospholipid/cholesterol/gamma-HCH transport system substrate-binding protein
VSGATRAQKVRLGIFLGVAGTILGGTLIGMVGLAAIEKRDEYPVRFEGSVAGLSPGSPVRYNGIDVGRVDSVRIDPKKPSGVLVTISLVEGTPLRDDTVAVLNLQGITGLKFIELQGGREDASNIEPGTEVPSSRSTVDLLTDKAQSIALKIEDVLDNLGKMTSGDNAKSISAILTSVDSISASIARILEDNSSSVATLVTDARAVVTDVRALIATTKTTITNVDGAIGRASEWVNPADVQDTFGRLQSTLGRVELTLSGVDDAVKNVRNRLSAAETGAAIAAFTGLATSSTDLVKRADSTLLRAREDLFRVLDAVTEGAESFAELANLLRDDPASLLRGKGRDREVPE